MCNTVEYHSAIRKGNLAFCDNMDETEGIELSEISHHRKTNSRDFPGGAVVKNPPASAGDMGSIPGPGRSSEAHAPRARTPQREATAVRSHAPQQRVAPARSN